MVQSDWDSAGFLAELAHGMRLDTNYYYWPPSWANQIAGHFTGSGMPMRIARLDGTIVDVYQATIKVPDETLQAEPGTLDTLLDNALGATGYYAAVTTNMHTDVGAPLDSQTMSLQMVAASQSRGVPVVTAKQMLTWLDGRNGSTFSAMSWSGTTLTFTVTAAAGTNGIQAMLPVNSAAGGLSLITKSGSAVSFTLQTIKGIQYAFFTVSSGTYAATYGGLSVSVAPPTVSLAASQSQQFTATVLGGSSGVTWTSGSPGVGTLTSAGRTRPRARLRPRRR